MWKDKIYPKYYILRGNRNYDVYGNIYCIYIYVCVYISEYSKSTKKKKRKGKYEYYFIYKNKIYFKILFHIER